VLVRAVPARISPGTSNGYSTLWLASAARDRRRSDLSAVGLQVELARENFRRSGLADHMR
jgi:predicted O-methyltransferase YrrM